MAAAHRAVGRAAGSMACSSPAMTVSTCIRAHVHTHTHTAARTPTTHVCRQVRTIFTLPTRSAAQNARYQCVLRTAAAAARLMELSAHIRRASTAHTSARNQQYNEYVRRSAELEKGVGDAISSGDRLRALELIEDAADMGARPCRRSIENTIRLLCSVGDAENAHRAQVILRRYGYDPGPMSLANLLMVYGTQLNAKGVHETVRDLERLNGPIGDNLWQRLCYAYFSIGCRDACFRIIDTFRSAGGPAADLIRFVLRYAGTLPPGSVQDSAGISKRRALALDAQRKMLAYILLAHSHAPVAAADEVAAWVDSLLARQSYTLLVEGLAYKKIADAIDPERLQAVFSALLRSFRGSLVQHKESVHDLHVGHTLEEFANGVSLDAATLEQRARIMTVLYGTITQEQAKAEAESAERSGKPEGAALSASRVDNETLPSITTVTAAMAAAARTHLNPRVAWVHWTLQAADQHYVGPTFASLEVGSPASGVALLSFVVHHGFDLLLQGAVALTTWRHDSTLKWHEAFDRQLRYLVATYLRLEALGHGATVASGNLVHLFELLLRRRKITAAVQVAMRLESRGVLFLDAVPLHRLFVHITHHRFDTAEKTALMHRLAGHLMPQELLDVYRTFLSRRPGLKRKLLPAIPATAMFSLNENAPEWMIKRAPVERAALVHTKRGGKTPGLLPPILICQLRSEGGSGAASGAEPAPDRDDGRSPTFVLVTQAGSRQTSVDTAVVAPQLASAVAGDDDMESSGEGADDDDNVSDLDVPGEGHASGDDVVLVAPDDATMVIDPSSMAGGDDETARRQRGKPTQRKSHSYSKKERSAR